MSAYDAVLAERRRQRRIARRIEATLVLIVGAAALLVFLLYHPGPADAKRPLAHIASYNHIDACKSSLRGGGGSDDDVHRFGVATGAQSFGGWGGYGHYSDGSAWVWGYFNYSYGKVALAKGRCSGGDYAADWFDA